jgi:hypothetical protein
MRLFYGIGRGRPLCAPRLRDRQGTAGAELRRRAERLTLAEAESKRIDLTVKK